MDGGLHQSETFCKVADTGRTQLPNVSFELAVGLAEIAKNKSFEDHFNLRGAIQVGNRGADENR